MYVTRPLSLYRKNPSSLSLPPPEGPNSGILVIQDEESFCCFGLVKVTGIYNLPLPQNTKILVRPYQKYNEEYPVYFFPVINQPLSSNQYYAIDSSTGMAYRSSTDEDEATSCCGTCTYIQDVVPQPLDPSNIYQQFKISSDFLAGSVAPDGYPPYFLRGRQWSVRTSTPHHYQLGTAYGLDTSLRAHLPVFDFPFSNEASDAMVIGKWYCPFMFVRENMTLSYQMEESMFYEMTLEQQWVRIFACDNNSSQGKAVSVDVAVDSEKVFVAGVRADLGKVVESDGVMWFKSFGKEGKQTSVGLSLVIVERMKWEQERVGWIGEKDKQVRVKRVEEFGGIGEWKNFDCYVLVERFVLRRMDDTLVLAHEYWHTHQIRSKWE